MKYIWVLLGFIILALGFCSMILDVMGLTFTFMSWIFTLDGLYRLIIYMVMCFGGVAIMYLNATDWKKDQTRYDQAEF